MPGPDPRHGAALSPDTLSSALMAKQVSRSCSSPDGTELGRIVVQQPGQFNQNAIRTVTLMTIEHDHADGHQRRRRCCRSGGTNTSMGLADTNTVIGPVEATRPRPITETAPAAGTSRRTTVRPADRDTAPAGGGRGKRRWTPRAVVWQANFQPSIRRPGGAFLPTERHNTRRRRQLAARQAFSQYPRIPAHCFAPSRSCPPTWASPHPDLRDPRASTCAKRSSRRHFRTTNPPGRATSRNSSMSAQIPVRPGQRT